MEPVPTAAERLASFLRRRRRELLLGWLPAAAALLAVAVWYVYTFPVRGELRRVEARLEAMPQLQDVSVSIPWFTRVMPDRVPVSATGVPGGYPSEVHIPLAGEYDTRSRKAFLSGRTQVLLISRMVELKWELDVPKGAG